MIPGGRRRNLWLLIGATVTLVPATILLNRIVGFDEWRTVVGWSAAALPGTHAISGQEIASGLPVLSLVLDEADLHDPARGILANVMEHGAEWEREGSVSFFDKGRLQFATGVGVRIHGGSSRHASERQGFRLYFRRRYGATQVPPGVLFAADAQPIRRLVVHSDVRVDPDRRAWHFVNPLAYDIADAVGAIAPDTRPVRFHVNGEYYGVFVLTERMDEHFFEAHRGHGRIRLEQEQFDSLRAWVDGTRPLTIADVRTRIDLDNLARWFLAVAFTATRDAYQGPGQFEDRTREAPWFWVNWDMDQAFRTWDHDSYQYLLERVAEPRRGRNPAEPRSAILTQLIAEDAEFRAYFARLVQDALNHRLTAAFLEARFRYYEMEARTLGIADLSYLSPLRTFLQKRPAFFLAVTSSWLNTAPPQTLSVDVPPGEQVVIDGEAITGRYQGTYFQELDVSLSVPDEGRDRFRGWYVDGQAVGREPDMTMRVTRATTIVPSFGGVPGGSAPDSVTAALMSVDDTPAARLDAGGVPALSWARVPAAGFEVMPTEVTAAQFAAFAAFAGVRMPTQPSWYAAVDHPVTHVTWDEARGFCAWAGGRLPTNAEWTQAADTAVDQANIRGQSGSDRWAFTAPVGSLPPNRFGVYDMAGNVWEWTADTFTRAQWPGYEMAVVRGGSWDTSPRRSILNARTALSLGGRHNLYVGFRCVR